MTEPQPDPRNPAPLPGARTDAQIPDAVSRRRKPLRTAVLIVIPAILLTLVGRSIYLEWERIRAYEWDLHIGWLAASAILMWIVLVWIVMLWRWLVSEISGIPLRAGTAYRIAMLANLGKYIPGKVWAVLGMVVLLRREGYPATVALAATALHQAYQVVAGAAFMITVLGTDILGDSPVAAVVIGLGGTILCLYPPVFSFILNTGLRLLKRPTVTIPRSFSRTVVRFFAYVLSWIMYGTSLYFMLLGIGLEPGAYWETVAAFGAGYLLGFLALFAPGGLGVREGVTTSLLARQIGGGLAGAASVVARVWTTVLEMVALIPIAGSVRKTALTQTLNEAASQTDPET